MVSARVLKTCERCLKWIKDILSQLDIRKKGIFGIKSIMWSDDCNKRLTLYAAFF